MTTERREPNGTASDGGVIKMVVRCYFDEAGVAIGDQYLIVVNVCRHRVGMRMLVRRIERAF
jgi:hypothetical protein